jgi:hypothetical protein
MSSRKLFTMVVVPTSKQILMRPLLSTNSTSATSALFFPPQISSTTTASHRLLSTKSLSPSVTLVSNSDSIQSLRSRPDLSSYSSEGRPLTILLCWLMAKNNAVKKYAQFYLDQGFDVLTVRITPWQLLLPSRIEPIIRNEVLPTLLSSDHEKKLIHGFSVGGYVFARILKHMERNPEACRDLIDSLKGQVWDSVVDVNGVSIGVSKSVFMDSPTMQKALQSYIEFHMNAFYHFATKYYLDAHDSFYYKPLRTPALFLASAADQISTIDVIGEVQTEWTKKGISTEQKVWPNTGHVGHMKAYPEEYKTTLRNFLQKNGLKPSESYARRRVHVPYRERVVPHGIPNVVYTRAL